MPLQPRTSITALTATAGVLCVALWAVQSGTDTGSGPARSGSCDRIDAGFIMPAAEAGDRFAVCRGRTADGGETRLVLNEVRDDARQTVRRHRLDRPREVIDFADSWPTDP